MKRRLLNYFSPHRLASHRFYFWAHTDLTDLTVFALVGGKSHRCFCVWAGSHGFHFAFGLTQISQIPQYCFVGGKSHGGWENGCGVLSDYSECSECSGYSDY